MKRESATIKKIAAAWNKKLWGFYDLQAEEIKNQKARELEKFGSQFLAVRKSLK